MGRTDPGRYLLLCLLVALTSLSSCTQFLGGKAEIRQKRRFTLIAEPIGRYLKGSQRPYNHTVQLQTFDIAGAYNQSEIIFRSSLYELSRDPLHTWGQRPREMITDIVDQYFKEAQLFTRLVTDRDLLDERPDYLLSGTVKALERFDSGDRWFARLVMSMQLVDQTNSQVIWRGEIGSKNELEVFNADMEYTVQGMSEILRRKMGQFVREIDSIFLNMKNRQEGSLSQAVTLADTTQTSMVDTIKAKREIPDYYELIPGKLAPE